jgi:hypothetical protein
MVANALRVAMLSVVASLWCLGGASDAARFRSLGSHRSQRHGPAGQTVHLDQYLPATEAQLHYAGRPEMLSKLAHPSDTPHYYGYYVGGGSPKYRCARWRTVEEGTWGWDYVGRIVPRRVCLLWWCPPKYQGGAGAYKTDGPKIVEHE